MLLFYCKKIRHRYKLMLYIPQIKPLLTQYNNIPYAATTQSFKLQQHIAAIKYFDISYIDNMGARNILYILSAVIIFVFIA